MPKIISNWTQPILFWLIADGLRRPTQKSALKSIIFVALLTLMLPAFAQSKQSISGTVRDEKGTELPGVSIVLKNTQVGTTTDASGNFILAVPEAGSILVFTYIGFANQEITISSQTRLDVVLKADEKILNEVVVVGYGTQTRRDITGAVATINNENFNQGAITNPLQQIAGRAAGVNVTQTGSEPGSAPSVRIRGITSLIGGSDPLVVVDGIQGNMDLLNQIPPSEIESVDVLKDASATAIYGSRGAPGVIIITTKKIKPAKQLWNTTLQFRWTRSRNS